MAGKRVIVSINISLHFVIRLMMKDWYWFCHYLISACMNLLWCNITFNFLLVLDYKIFNNLNCQFFIFLKMGIWRFYNILWFHGIFEVRARPLNNRTTISDKIQICGLSIMIYLPLLSVFLVQVSLSSIYLACSHHSILSWYSKCIYTE